MLKDNDIEIYSTYNGGKSVVAERFIRTLKNKIYKHMTGVSKIVYLNGFYDIANIYNNTYDQTVKVRPIDIKSNSYVEYNIDSNEKYPKFRIGDPIRILKF